jgi:Domain of unknown function (DUF1835)
VLHVTNGDCAAGGLRQAALPGTVVISADVLHDGPAPVTGDDDWHRLRADYLASRGTGSAERIRSELAAWDAAVDAGIDEDEVVLWFEHDLFDQLLLIRLLDRIAGWAQRPRVTLVSTDRYLGPLSPPELSQLFPTRSDVSDDQLKLGRTAWGVFRSSDPSDLEAVLALDTGSLPFLAAALRRHLEEFPSAREGLSRTERDILTILMRGPRSPRDLFPAQQIFEDRIFMGDSTFAWILHQLADSTPALISMKGEAATDALPAGVASITAFGRQVVEGQADRVAACGIDRWLGGVHLRGRGPVWRWDPAGRRLASR